MIKKLNLQNFSSPVAMLSVLVLLTGCPEQSDHSTASEEVSAISMNLELNGKTWRIDNIDQGNIVESSIVTIEFLEDGRISGRTGCNNYFGGAAINGNSISISGTGATQMACTEELMLQERHFFEALSSSEKLAMKSDGSLLFFDAQGVERLRAIHVKEEAQTTAGPEPMDLPATSGFSFTCEAGDVAAVRFLGPETIELKFRDKTYQLPRERSASGAKYSSEGVSFWNKGDSAMIDIGSTRYNCNRN